MQIIYKITKVEAKEAYRKLNNVGNNIDIEIEDSPLLSGASYGLLGQSVSNGLIRPMELTSQTTYKTT